MLNSAWLFSRKTFYAVSLGASPQRPAAICRLFFSLPPWQRVQNRTPGTARCRAGGISAAQHSQASFDGSPVRSRSRMASMPRCVSCAVLACASSSFRSSDIFFHSTDIYTFPVAAGPLMLPAPPYRSAHRTATASRRVRWVVTAPLSVTGTTPRG